MSLFYYVSFKPNNEVVIFHKVREYLVVAFGLSIVVVDIGNH